MLLEAACVKVKEELKGPAALSASVNPDVVVSVISLVISFPVTKNVLSTLPPAAA